MLKSPCFRKCEIHPSRRTSLLEMMLGNDLLTPGLSPAWSTLTFPGHMLAPVWPEKIQSNQVTVPDRRRFGHVDVVSAGRCSHVWRGGGKRGRGVRQGTEKQSS